MPTGDMWGPGPNPYQPSPTPKRKRHWLRWTFAAIAALAVIGGIGAAVATSNPDSKPAAVASSAPATSTTRAAATQVPPAKPAVWTMSQARSHYLALAKSINATEAKLKPWAYGGTITESDLPKVKRIAKAIAQADDALMRKLSAGRWPAATRTAIQRLISGAARERVVWLNVAQADTAIEAATEWNIGGAAIDAVSAASQRARVALGLPGTG